MVNEVDIFRQINSLTDPEAQKLLGTTFMLTVIRDINENSQYIIQNIDIGTTKEVSIEFSNILKPKVNVYSKKGISIKFKKKKDDKK